MASRKFGTAALLGVVFSAISTSASQNTDGINLQMGSRILNFGQFVVSGTTYGDAAFVLTPEHSIDNVNFYPITNASTKTVNAATPKATVDFVTCLPYVRLAMTYSGTAHPEMTVQYSVADAQSAINLTMSAGAVVATTGTFSGAISGATTLAITGASTLTGNVACGGTLAVTGASTLTGNVGCGGTLAVTGVTTLTGALVANGGATINGSTLITKDTRTGAGAVSITKTLTEVVTTGADALTLADGAAGQIKIITMITDGGDGTLTPANPLGFATITFNDVGDSVILVFLNSGWHIVANNGCTVA